MKYILPDWRVDLIEHAGNEPIAVGYEDYKAFAATFVPANRLSGCRFVLASQVIDYSYPVIGAFCLGVVFCAGVAQGEEKFLVIGEDYYKADEVSKRKTFENCDPLRRYARFDDAYNYYLDVMRNCLEYANQYRPKQQIITDYYLKVTLSNLERLAKRR